MYDVVNAQTRMMNNSKLAVSLLDLELSRGRLDAQGVVVRRVDDHAFYRQSQIATENIGVGFTGLAGILSIVMTISRYVEPDSS